MNPRPKNRIGLHILSEDPEPPGRLSCVLKLSRESTSRESNATKPFLFNFVIVGSMTWSGPVGQYFNKIYKGIHSE